VFETDSEFASENFLTGKDDPRTETFGGRSFLMHEKRKIISPVPIIFLCADGENNRDGRYYFPPPFVG